MKNFKIIPIHRDKKFTNHLEQKDKDHIDIDLLPGEDIISPMVSPGTSPIETGFITKSPLSPRTLRVRENSILYSLGRNGKILTFAHSDYKAHRNHCINLRHENNFNVAPMPYKEYFHESNKYCICMIADYERKNVKVMGFILYRKKYMERKINILDIVFYNKREFLDQFCPEFSDIEISVECMRAFSEFVDEINYTCVWRPAIKWKFLVSRKKQQKNKN